MRQRLGVILVFLIIFALFVSFASAQETTPEPDSAEATPEITAEPDTATPEVTPEVTAEPDEPTPTDEAPGTSTGNTYTVKRGDTLYRIAVNNNTTTAELVALNGIANPRIIYVGQVLRLPGSGSGTTPPSSGGNTPAPSGNTYIVQIGDTLGAIAARYNTSIALLAQLNGIANPNIIYVGQRLALPSETDSTPGGSGDTGSTVDVDFEYGVEVFVNDSNISTILSEVQQLGVTWVKIRVNWRALEPVMGQFNFTVLDAAVDAFESAGIDVLLTLTAAPDWTRPSIGDDDRLLGDGPPDEYSSFAAFVSTIVRRYEGKVDAYQIWEEPNLRRNWYSTEHPLGADSYAQLLATAYEIIKDVDENTVVVTAGLAPTGWNDHFNAIDDRVFLQDMFSNGVKDASDAIGAHPVGWANPPNAVCCDQPAGVDTHFDSTRFYFLDTLNEYRAILVRNGAGNMPIWVTKFGWGSSSGNIVGLPTAIQEDPDRAASYVYLDYTSESEQALYLRGGFERGEALGFVGPMFVSNLNACQFNDWEGCFSSLLDTGGNPRPAFTTLQSIEKTSGE